MGGDFKNNRKQAERPPKMVFKADLAGSKEYTISIIDMGDRDDLVLHLRSLNDETLHYE